MTTTRKPDQYGNRIATEGVTRCPCGAKYWEYDKCMSCGGDARDALPEAD